MNPAAEIWEKVKALMGSEMTATTLNTWFDDSQAVALEENRFVLYSGICPGTPDCAPPGWR